MTDLDLALLCCGELVTASADEIGTATFGDEEKYEYYRALCPSCGTLHPAIDRV